MRVERNILLLILVLIAVVNGCARKAVDRPGVPPEKALAELDAKDLSFDDDLDKASLVLALDRSIAYYDKLGRNQTLRVADRLVSAGRMKESLVAFRRILQSDAGEQQKKKQIAETFLVLRAAGGNGDGAILFTGYYEPLLEGSLTRTDKYRYPLYKSPPDLLVEKISPHETKIGRRVNGRIVPYYTRREIDVDGVLAGKGLELAWVSDPVELFTLHIQGSAKIRLEDGKTVTVSPLQNNGWPYRSMPGDLLAQIRRDQGNTSYANVNAWLSGKSDSDLFQILSYYDRYIFFRFVDAEPIGALGQPVTPDRTIATDPAYFPQGALAFIRLSKPVLDEEHRVTKRVPFSRFVLNQDKGSAIKGPGRVDLFCGFGSAARATAGSLKEKGELYFLLLK